MEAHRPPEHGKAAPVTHPATSEISRRTLLVAMSGLLSGAAFARSEGNDSQPATAASEAYTPAGFRHALPPEALEEPLATLEQPGALDLNDPEGLRLARMKTMFSLNADYAYSAYMTRHFVMPPDATPYPLVNELELNVSFLTTGGPEFREEYEQGKLMLHGSYTRVFLDAATLQTVDAIDVPAMNRQLTLAPTQFALSIPMDLAPIPHDPTLTEDLRWYRFGEDVHLTNIALFEPSESRPPRMDTSVWRVKHADLMDPAHRRLHAHYSFTASSYAALYAWTGLGVDDPTRVVTSKAGIKVHTIDALPALVRERILEKHPERVPRK